MLRIFGEGAVLFLLPFIGYVLLLLTQRRFPFVREAWGNRLLVPLAAVGLVFAIIGLIGLGLLSERHRGGYQPAHIEGGRLVPGQMQ